MASIVTVVPMAIALLALSAAGMEISCRTNAQEVQRQQPVCGERIQEVAPAVAPQVIYEDLEVVREVVTDRSVIFAGEVRKLPQANCPIDSAIKSCNCWTTSNDEVVQGHEVQVDADSPNGACICSFKFIAEVGVSKAVRSAAALCARPANLVSGVAPAKMMEARRPRVSLEAAAAVRGSPVLEIAKEVITDNTVLFGSEVRKLPPAKCPMGTAISGCSCWSTSTVEVVQSNEVDVRKEISPFGACVCSFKFVSSTPGVSPGPRFAAALCAKSATLTGDLV